MKNSAADGLPALRYHVLGADKLYAPIPFLFVTDRMCREIAAERRQILDALQPPQRERQLKRFERYNPEHSSTAFNALLKLFNPTGE